LRRFCPCPPRGLLASLVTKGEWRSVFRRCVGFISSVFASSSVLLAAVLFGVVWSITEDECLPGGNLFGVTTLFICALIGGKLVALIRLPRLPPFPPLLGMLLMGFLLRNIPVVTDGVYINYRWSASLRNIALAVILARAGLGLDPAALRKLKSVCVRVAAGPCIVEASTTALISHFLMGLPWVWGFILGFVLGAVSPAVVVPSMLLLQKNGYGVEQGIPTLLMAAGSFDDILAITGFTTCLGVAFATGSTWYNLLRGALEVAGGLLAGLLLGFIIQYFPSIDQVGADFRLRPDVSTSPSWGRNVWILLCCLDLTACISLLETCCNEALLLGPGSVRLCCVWQWRGGFPRFWRPLHPGAGFPCWPWLGHRKGNKESSLCTSGSGPAAIGSTALDMARSKKDLQLQKYGMDVLTVAVLAILLTAPVGALVIGLAGPHLLRKPKSSGSGERVKPTLSAFFLGR
ncbi:unnamed protein product, partial [Tetraodon nigroviridis]